MDAHQWDQVDNEAYSEGGMSLTPTSSNKSQQHQLLQVLNENHPQESYQSSHHPPQQQTPDIVASSQGYPHSLQQSAQEDPEQSSLSSYHSQQWQISVKVPPQRPPSKDIQPTSYQSFHSPQKQQPSGCSNYLSNHSHTPKTEHSNTCWTQSSDSVQAPSPEDPTIDHNPINDDHPPPDREELEKTYPQIIATPKAETLPKNVSIPKSETPPEKVDSTEMLPKNVGVRRTATLSKPSFCSGCCIC